MAILLSRSVHSHCCCCCFYNASGNWLSFSFKVPRHCGEQALHFHHIWSNTHTHGHMHALVHSHQPFPHKCTFTASIARHKKIVMIIGQSARALTWLRANGSPSQIQCDRYETARPQLQRKTQHAQMDRETGSECWRISLPSPSRA